MMRLLHFKPTISIWKRFLHEQSKQRPLTWLEPVGYKTNINIYNHIKKCNVPLILKNEKIATWYMCGPTVYDSAHIGHACTFVRFDILRRILRKFFNIHVVTVMSITDIDDKIIKRAAECKEDWKQLTKRYEQEFVNEMQTLSVTPPYLYCRVTDYIPQVVNFVEKILATNAAYIGKDGSVYFDTTEYDKYGKLYKLQPGKEHDIKKTTHDFTLWKAAKPGEPFWESPWGPGRPGWHIECSAMASATLGSAIDIHSGGVDLLFPHHENEETQSCCYHRIDQWVNYWLHSGNLFLSGEQKMSKSLQNTLSIKELLEHYNPNQFRLFCLLTHYRTEIEFSPEKMRNAVAMLNKFHNFLSDCRNYVSGKLTAGIIDEAVVLETLKTTKGKVLAALANDFDTTGAIFAIQDLVTVVTKMLKQPDVVKNTLVTRNTSSIAAVAEYITETLSDFGFSENIDTERNQHKLTEVVNNFVSFRQTVRHRLLEQTVKDKDLLKACDEARDNLLACGVKIKDHKTASTWTAV